MRIIAVLNQKGGAGKTTTALNVGAGLARLGRSVLLADLDPQAHLTCALGVPAHSLGLTVHDALTGATRPAACLLQVRDLLLLPASLVLSGAELDLAAAPGREFLLRKALEDLPGRDVAILDCPPSLGLLTLNALTAASEIVVPLQAEFLALQSLSTLLETVDAVRRRLNPGLAVTGIVCTRFNRRLRLNREVAGKIRSYFGDLAFETHIRENVALAESPGFGQDIFTYRPGSSGARDYLALCREIDRRQ